MTPPTPRFPAGRWVFVKQWNVAFETQLDIEFSVLIPKKLKLDGTYTFVTFLIDEGGNTMDDAFVDWELIVPEEPKPSAKGGLDFDDKAFIQSLKSRIK
jgi:hypothetical protein